MALRLTELLKTTTQVGTHVQANFDPKRPSPGAGTRGGSSGQLASRPRRVTFHEAGDYHPVWSPDGSRIALASNRNGHFSVWVVAAGGGEPQAIATHPGDMPSWSPDGR